MNAIHANSHLQTTSVHGKGTLRCSAIADEDRIRQALANFEKRGGLIRILPPQVAPDRNLVGAQYAVYEGLIEAVGLKLF